MPVFAVANQVPGNGYGRTGPGFQTVWTDPAVWIKANPSLGVTVKIEDLKRQVDEAREMPAQQNAIRRLRLNEIDPHNPQSRAPRSG